jgi:chorismate mutase
MKPPAKIASMAELRAEVDAQGLDPELAEALWRQLMTRSITREEAAMTRGDGA